MGKYLVIGLSGTGKSTTAHRLQERGYKVIDADDPATGMCYYKDIETNQFVLPRPVPPFSAGWLKRHKWVWDPAKLHEYLDEAKGPIFICGDASNERDFYPLFDKIFGLYVSKNHTIATRLQGREPERWADGTDDLIDKLARHTVELDRLRQAGAIIIDASQPTEQVVDEILSNIDDK